MALTDRQVLWAEVSFGLGVVIAALAAIAARSRIVEAVAGLAVIVLALLLENRLASRLRAAKTSRDLLILNLLLAGVVLLALVGVGLIGLLLI